MTSKRACTLASLLLSLLGCTVDDRTLSSRKLSAKGGSTSATACAGDECSGSSGGSNSTESQALSSCNDLNGNGTLDKLESLAENPTFDADSGAWEPEVGIGIVWNALDVCSSTSSGALNVTYQKSGSAMGVPSAAAVQCITAEAGASYALSAKFYLRTPGSQGNVGIAFFSTANCSGTGFGGADSPTLTEVGAWASSSLTSTAPATALSLQVRLTAGRSDWATTQSQADVLVDAVLVEVTK